MSQQMLLAKPVEAAQTSFILGRDWMGSFEGMGALVH
jgi:hypothetical protein